MGITNLGNRVPSTLLRLRSFVLIGALTHGWGCKQSQFSGAHHDGGRSPGAEQRATDTGRPTDSDESVPGYLLNPSAMTVQFTDDQAQLTAAAGSYVETRGGNLPGVWEFTAEQLAAGKLIQPGRGFIFGIRLMMIAPNPDGSFSAAIPRHPGTLQALAVDGNAEGFFVFSSNRVTAVQLAVPTPIPLDFSALGWTPLETTGQESGSISGVVGGGPDGVGSSEPNPIEDDVVMPCDPGLEPC